MRAPARRVVIATRSVSTAKWTIALRRSLAFGSWSLRYWLIECSTPCPVRAFFSSAVATGDAVDEQAEVERLRRGRLVGELAGDGETIAGVALLERVSSSLHSAPWVRPMNVNSSAVSIPEATSKSGGDCRCLTAS